MKLTGRFVGAMIGATLLPLVIGCERHSSAEHYYLVTTNTRLAYWQAAADGLAKASAQYGVHADLRGPENYDAQAEVQEFRSVVALKPDGILVSVADAALMRPEIDSAVAAGIPVITLDSDAPESHRLYFIGTNNTEAGRLGGEELVRRLGGKGNVVFFTMPGQPNLDERLKGYEDALSNSAGINVVAIVDIRGQGAVAFDKTEEYLARAGKDKINAFVCLEASAGKEVAEVFRRNKVEDRVIVAMDLDPDTLDLVKSGIIDATIAQKPFTMAYVGVKALDELHHYPLSSPTTDFAVDPFAPVPAFVDTGVSVVSASNVDYYLRAQKAARNRQGL